MGAVVAMSLLRTSGLTRRFGGLTAVDNVDFALPTGQVHALIGPNGAGKSTFVGMVSGRIEASEGRVEFEGRDVTALPAHQRIRAGMAYTFQITSIYARLSLFENIALAMGNRNHDAAQKALARVGLDDRADQIAGDLSYGHQRLLEIAMGVAQSPKLLILDEPNSALDAEGSDAMNAALRDFKARGKAAIIMTHRPNAIAECDQLMVLENGLVTSLGPRDAVMRKMLKNADKVERTLRNRPKEAAS